MDKLLRGGKLFADARKQTYSYVSFVLDMNPFLYNKY
jgi:hypothetical protein